MKNVVTTFAIMLPGLTVIWLIISLLLDLPAISPEEMGLRWQECKLSAGYGTRQQAEQCFGPLESLQSVESSEPHAERVGMDNFRLKIGQDTYETSRNGKILSSDVFELSKNGFPLYTLTGVFYAHSPNIGLYNIGGKSVWEFADQIKATIIYDGQDVRRTMRVNKAQRPYQLANKLIFIGQKSNKYFVVYDGKKLTPEFDDVIIAYCCESLLYSPFGGQGFYIFNGTRDGQKYMVKISMQYQ